MGNVERIIWTLKRVKTSRRNCTRQERFIGMTLMTLHRNIPISEEAIIDMFAI